MIGMREQIARGHFEEEKRRNLRNLEQLYGGLPVRSWTNEHREMFADVVRTSWESIEQRDRDGYLALADVALICLLKPTPGMLEVAHDNPDWYGGLQGHNAAEEKAFTEMWMAAIQAAKDGK